MTAKKVRHDKIIDAFVSIIKGVDNNVTSHTIKISNDKIVTLNIFQSYALKRTFNEKLNRGKVMAYCINNKIQDCETHLNCWICDKLGTNETIYKYNTIFNTSVKLHDNCFNKCNSCRTRSMKKTLSVFACEDYSCLITPHNQIFIYNMSNIYMINFSPCIYTI